MEPVLQPLVTCQPCVKFRQPEGGEAVVLVWVSVAVVNIMMKSSSGKEGFFYFKAYKSIQGC